MKLKHELVIAADRDAVWAAFDNPDNLRRWQPTLTSCTRISGEPGQPESTAELVYDENGRRVVMTETITERRKPDFIAGIYETRHSTTLIFNTFEQAGENRTRWTAWTNMSFKGLMKIMAVFSVKALKRRTEDDMQRFKLMVETDRANEPS